MLGKTAEPEMPVYTRSRRVFRDLATIVAVVLLIFWLRYKLAWEQLHTSITPAHDRVPLEAHIISKCPDTRDALRQLVLPVMQRVEDKVDFRLTYIGKPTGDEGIECLHGPSECMGNIIELCAHELYPDPKRYLGFTMCLTKDYRHIPERSLVEDCALEHAIDFQALNDCAARDDGSHGMELLRKSVERSAEVRRPFLQVV